MQDFRGNFKKIEFPQHTPVRTQSALNDFQSSQKLKYENLQQPIIRQQQFATPNPTSYIPKENSKIYSQSSILATLISKELYDNIIPVKLKSLEREDWNTNLNLKMILQQSSSIHGQILHIELTEEANLYNHLINIMSSQFLQVLDLSEGEFVILKNEQSLHVDFGNFPYKLADLLQLCINSMKDERVSFFITLDMKSASGESIFNVVENNEFKKLVHLSLKFKTATDEVLKNFLSQRLGKEKVENEENRGRIKKLEDQLQEKLWELDQMRNDMRKMSEERDSQIQSILLQEQKKFNDHKEQQNYKESNLIKECENERKMIVDKYDRIISEISQKNEKLFNQNQELGDYKLQLESKERDLQNKLKTIEKEYQSALKELDFLRGDNKGLDSLKFQQEKLLTELRMTAQHLEKQLSEKENIIDNKQQMINNFSKQNGQLEDQIQQLKKQLEKLENRYQICTEEVNKGNQIIEKLQNQLDKQKEKVKLKNTIVIQQEQSVQKLQETIDSNQKQINEMKREKDIFEIRGKELETLNKDLKDKLIESQKLIESNNQSILFLNLLYQVIQYLNKQLNDTKTAPPQLNQTFKSQGFSQTYTKYISPTPLQEDKNYHNTSQFTQNQFQFQQQPQQTQVIPNNVSQMLNTSQISNRYNF